MRLSDMITCLSDAGVITQTEADALRRSHRHLDSLIGTSLAKVGEQSHKFFRQVEYIRCHADKHDFGDEDDALTEYKVVEGRLRIVEICLRCRSERYVKWDSIRRRDSYGYNLTEDYRASMVPGFTNRDYKAILRRLKFENTVKTLYEQALAKQLV